MRDEQPAPPRDTGTRHRIRCRIRRSGCRASSLTTYLWTARKPRMRDGTGWHEASAFAQLHRGRRMVRGLRRARDLDRTDG